jgi:hypothetical protein
MRTAPGTSLKLEARTIGGQRVAAVQQSRDIPLGSVDKSLRGVVAEGIETVLVGARAGRAAVLGPLPNRDVTAAEVQFFAKTLLARDQIRFEEKKQATGGHPSPFLPTHAIRAQRGRKVLRRIRFLCGTR